MNQVEVKIPQNLPQKLWTENFPNKPFPTQLRVDQGADHQVVLLGNHFKWEIMLRFGITRDISVESDLLKYLHSQNPPVDLVRTLKIVDTGASPPFDRCLIQVPINGEVFYEYMKHADATQQQRVGDVLGKFVKWVSILSPGMFRRKDILKDDFLGNKKMSHSKLIRAGLSKEKATDLLARVEEVFDTQSVIAPCHGDIYPPHIFVDESLFVGIIDWGDSTLAEPIRDFRFWYEPFEETVYKELYPESFRAACKAFRKDFPTHEEEKRLKLYALTGSLNYEDEEELEPVNGWIKNYINDFA